MAQEIVADVKMSLVKGNYTPSFELKLKPNQTGTGFNQGVEDLTTAESDLTTGLTTDGWIAFKNTSTSVSIDWGPKSGTQVLIGTLLPGEWASFRVGVSVTMTFNTQGSGTTADLQWMIFEE